MNTEHMFMDYILLHERPLGSHILDPGVKSYFPAACRKIKDRLRPALILFRHWEGKMVKYSKELADASKAAKVGKSV
jgi:hypothetical protein